MRSISTLVLLLLLESACSRPSAPDLQQLERRVVWEAVKAKDMSTLETYFADDFVEVSDNGTFRKADVMKIVPELVVRDYQLSDFQTVTLTDRSAVVTYRAVQHWVFQGQPGPEHVFATSAWASRNGQWRIVFHQEITAPPH